jgi:hypothetical protein
MEMVSGLRDCFLSVSSAFTAPTFRSLCAQVVGWLFAPRRTISGILVASGLAGTRHHSAFYRVFSSAKWSLDELGLLVARLVIECFCLQGTVFLAVDDTLARKRGTKIHGVGMHHDPLLSSRKTSVKSRAHCWVVLAIVVPVPWAKKVVALPILFRLYRSPKSLPQSKPSDSIDAARTKPQLAVELLKLLAKALPGRKLHLLGDGAYGCKEVVCNLPANVQVTSRIRLDARLFGEAPPRTGRAGRPALRGERLPTPTRLLETRCGTTHVLNLYGRREKARIVAQDALWYATAGTRMLRVVAVQSKTKGRTPQAFYTTDLDATPLEVLTRYAMRWSIEVAFRDAKQHLGFEDPQSTTRKAVLRVAPFAMLLLTFVYLAFAKTSRHDSSRIITPRRPWYTQRSSCSFADLLATLRQQTVRAHISSVRHDPNQLAESLEALVCHCTGAA